MVARLQRQLASVIYLYDQHIVQTLTGSIAYENLLPGSCFWHFCQWGVQLVSPSCKLPGGEFRENMTTHHSSYISSESGQPSTDSTTF